jgi:hypothetical protein
MFLRRKRREELEKAERRAEEMLFQEYEKERVVLSKTVLTISANDYVARNGKSLSDYDFRSVDGTYLGTGNRPFGSLQLENIDVAVLNAKDVMWERARKLGAEVVVGSKASIAYHGLHYVPVHYMGTALIPKENGKEIKQEPREKKIQLSHD